MSSPRTLLNILGALMLVFAFGCAEEPEVETMAVTDGIDTDTSAVNITGIDDVPRLPDGTPPVQVVLTEMEIDMPSTLVEGRTLFTVRNEGDVEHNFEVEGQGIEEEFDQPLQAGEVKTMEVDLVPGEYRIYCPVGDHAGQGMEMTLTVTAADGTGDQTTETGTETSI